MGIEESRGMAYSTFIRAARSQQHPDRLYCRFLTPPAPTWPAVSLEDSTAPLSSVSVANPPAVQGLLFRSVVACLDKMLSEGGKDCGVLHGL